MKKVVVALVLSVALTGCATPPMLEAINEKAKTMSEQGHSIVAMSENEKNLADDDTLKVPAVISEVRIEEIEQKGHAGKTAGGAFLGTIGHLAGGVVDQLRDGEVVEIKTYLIETRSGQAIEIEQPVDEDEYEQDFKVGDDVLLRSLRPMDEGGNQLYLERT